MHTAPRRTQIASGRNARARAIPRRIDIRARLTDFLLLGCTLVCAVVGAMLLFEASVTSNQTTSHALGMSAFSWFAMAFVSLILGSAVIAVRRRVKKLERLVQAMSQSGQSVVDPRSAAEQRHDEHVRDQASNSDAGTWVAVLVLLFMLLLAAAGVGVALYREQEWQAQGLVEKAQAEAARAAERARQIEMQRLMAEAVEMTAEMALAEVPEKWKASWPSMKLTGRNGAMVSYVDSRGQRDAGVAELIDNLTDSDPGIRTDAARWLGVIGWPAREALQQLIALQTDMDAIVQQSAADAIKRIEKDQPTENKEENKGEKKDN